MDDLHVHRGAYTSRSHEAQQRLRVGHFLSVEADNHGLRRYPCAGCRTVRHDLLDHEPRRRGGGLHLYAEPRAWRLLRVPLRLKACGFGLSVPQSGRWPVRPLFRFEGAQPVPGEPFREATARARGVRRPPGRRSGDDGRSLRVA